MSDFDEIYREYAGAVFGVSLRAVSRPEVAEDITSEVFLAFRDQVDRVPREQLPAWLFAVAKRRAADYWRHHYVEQRWSEAVLQESPRSTTTEPEFPLETLLGRCTELKPMHRRCLILRFRHGMSRAEIAEHLRTSEMQVKNHLQYALKLLRDTFDASAAPLRPQAVAGRDDREKGMTPAV
ncbi:MAG: sigma-70 family RNA polymerase sigma factor [Acidobacteriota bacterium]